jgi:hypothetical protein
LLHASPVATEAKRVYIAPPSSELFAVCDDSTEHIVLTADTVHRMSTFKSYESMVVTELAESVINQICENAETVTHTETVMEKHENDSQFADTVTLTNKQ